MRLAREWTMGEERKREDEMVKGRRSKRWDVLYVSGGITAVDVGGQSGALFMLYFQKTVVKRREYLQNIVVERCWRNRMGWW